MIVDESYVLSEPSDDVIINSSDSNRNSIIRFSQKSGWLKKQSNTSKNIWAYRYFALDGQRLYYYKQPSNKIPSFILNFDQIYVDIHISLTSDPQEIHIIPINSPKVLNIRNSNKTDLLDWGNLLFQTIQGSKGRALKIERFNLKQKYWKNEIIFVKDFNDVIETGDILLLKNQNNLNAQSLGSYEHVCLFINYFNGVGILDADTDYGIRVLMWSDFINNQEDKYRGRLFVRQLKIEKTDEMMLKLEEFIKKIKGKKFNVSPVELLQRPSQDVLREDKKFFSCELVASAYKAMGLLSSDIPSANYSPQDFSAEKSLNLVGARLGREQAVEFEIY
jgi:PH domain